MCFCSCVTGPKLWKWEFFLLQVAEEKRSKLNETEWATLRVWLKCVFASEADTDGVVMSPGGRGVDYKPAENQVNAWIGSQLLSLSNSSEAVCPLRSPSLSPLTEWRQSTTRRYEAAALHLQPWIDTSLRGLISNRQSFTSELLQPLVESVCRGFKGALLLCGASTPKIHNLVDAHVIEQVTPHSHGHSHTLAVGHFPNPNLCFRSWQACLITWCLRWKSVGSPPCPSCRWLEQNVKLLPS